MYYKKFNTEIKKHCYFLLTSQIRVSARGEKILEVRVKDVMMRGLGSGGDGFGDGQSSEGGTRAPLQEGVDGAAAVGVVRPPQGGVQGLVHVLLHLVRAQLLMVLVVLGVQPFAPRRPWPMQTRCKHTHRGVN